MKPLVLGGMPTDVDVELLRREIGVPEPNELISYERLEEVLKVPRSKPRWWTVVAAWKRRLYRENNLVMRAVPREGYRALDSHSRVAQATVTYKHGLKRINNAAVMATRTDREGLDVNEVRVLDHIAVVGAQLRLHAATAARELRYPEPEARRLVAAG